MFTEDEAKTKWCPFARVTSIDDRPSARPDDGALIGPHTPSYNRQYVQDFDLKQQLQPDGRHARFNVIPTVALCIGSKCMAWRWNDNGSQNSVTARPASGKGYCGLAGAPYL